MKLLLQIEKIKDSSKKVKLAMFITYVDKDGSRTKSAVEITKDSELGQHIEAINDEMKRLKKEKKK